MGFFKEFKEFAMKGNVMDMAVGVIIGGAFGKIVSSLVNDILMPPIGALLGNVNFTDLRLDISKIRDMSQAVGEVVNEVTPDGVNIAGKAAETLEPVYWNYGAFIQQCIDFTILALCVFLMVKLMNRLMKKKEEAPQPAPEPAPTKEELLLAEIRDLLKEKKRSPRPSGRGDHFFMSGGFIPPVRRLCRDCPSIYKAVRYCSDCPSACPWRCARCRNNRRRWGRAPSYPI